jgi:hypothetical protein
VRRPTNNSHRHSHLPDSIFDIFVGKGDSQWLFSVYEDVVTQRSKFLRVARQQCDRWWQYNKARMLVDEDPQVFSAYLYTVYFGLESTREQIASDGPGTATKTVSKEKDVKKAKFLTDLHLLADKLRDPTTANLVIDELISVIDRSEELVQEIAVKVYVSAKSDSPLRRLVRDLTKEDNLEAEMEEDEASGLPYGLLQEVTDGVSRMEVDTLAYGVLQDVTDSVSRMQVDNVDQVLKPDRPKGLYHRETDRYEVDGGWTKASGGLTFRDLKK